MDWLLLLIAFFFGSVIWPLVQAITGNLLTDPVKGWLSNRSIASKRKRIDQLEKEFAAISKLYKNREERYLEFFHNLFLVLMVTAFGVGLALFAIALSDPLRQILLLLAAGVFIALVRVCYDFAIVVARVQRFDEYKQRTEDRIAELAKKLPVS